MTYLFENRELLYHMINHLNRRSIMEALYKVLISSTQLHDSDIKTDLFTRILDVFDPLDIEQSQNIADLLTDSLSNKKNYNLILHNPTLFQHFHSVCIKNLKFEFATKELLHVLIKLYENVLKDISNNPNSQIHLNFNDGMEFGGDIGNMMYEEEHNDKDHHKEIDIKTTMYIFPIIGETLKAIALDFYESIQATEEGSKQSHKKSLGVKRYTQLEYFRSVLELIVYGIASQLELDGDLMNMLKQIINTKVFEAIIFNFFEYEWNNLYQKVLEQIFNLIIYKSSPPELIENVLYTCKFIEIMISKIIKQKFTFPYAYLFKF